MKNFVVYEHIYGLPSFLDTVVEKEIYTFTGAIEGGWKSTLFLFCLFCWSDVRKILIFKN